MRLVTEGWLMPQDSLAVTNASARGDAGRSMAGTKASAVEGAGTDESTEDSEKTMAGTKASAMEGAGTDESTEDSEGNTGKRGSAAALSLSCPASQYLPLPLPLPFLALVAF